MPEVDRYRHEQLNGVNTSINESFNAWMDRFCNDVAHMHPTCLSNYTFLLADLWNTYIAPTSHGKHLIARPRPPQEQPKTKLKRWKPTHVDETGAASSSGTRPTTEIEDSVTHRRRPFQQRRRQDMMLDVPLQDPPHSTSEVATNEPVLPLSFLNRTAD